MKIGFYKLIFALCSFGQGLFIPVLSLLLLYKGMTLANIGLGMAAYAVTAVLLEVPSGIAADMLGKKRVFLLSLLITALACIFLMAGNGPALTIASLMLYGAGRALSSGTLDALFISRCQQALGNSGLPKGMKVLSVSESVGLAAGALSGGVLPAISRGLLPASGPYDATLMLRILLAIVVMILTILFIPGDMGQSKSKMASMRKQLMSGIHLVHGSKSLRGLFVAAIGIGFVLSLLEVYWQPYFQAMLGGQEGQTVYLGILSVAYFAAISAGSMLAEKWLASQRLSSKSLFLTSRSMMMVFMGSTALIRHPIFFAICFCLMYFMLGASNVAGGSIFHDEVPDSHRASFLSVQSLLLQAGSFAASFMGSAIISFISIPGLWLLGAGAASLLLLPSFYINSGCKLLDKTELKRGDAAQ